MEFTYLYRNLFAKLATNHKSIINKKNLGTFWLRQGSVNAILKIYNVLAFSVSDVPFFVEIFMQILKCVKGKIAIPSTTLYKLKNNI